MNILKTISPTRLLALAFLAVAAPLPAFAQTTSRNITTADGTVIHYIGAPAYFYTIQDSTTGRVSKGVGFGLPMQSGNYTILFVPGWSMPAWIWEHQITHFAKTHRVVAMDPRGQGESSKPNEGYHPSIRARDIKAVIDELKLAPVVLVGWSMGVTEVAAYVEQFGTAGLAGIVLVDGSAGMDFDAKITPSMMKFGASFLTDREKQTDSFVRGMYRKPQSEEYIKRVIAAALAMPTDSAVAAVMGMFASDYRPALAKIDKPTLVMAAGDDASNPWMRIYRDMAERIPGAKLEMFPGSGHALFVDDPARFNSLLDTFVAGLSTRSRATPN